MSVDFARYLHQVDPVPGLEHHVDQTSSCHSLANFFPHGISLHAQANSMSVPTIHCPSVLPSSGSDKWHKNRSNHEMRRNTNRRKGCLSESRLRQTEHQGERCHSPSIQNHWTLSYGYTASNLAVYLGRALTLHSSPRIKRKAKKKKKVKFADEQGETLVTFYIVPKIDLQETDYWSFLEQAVYDRECQEFSSDDDCCSSPVDMNLPWNVHFFGEKQHQEQSTSNSEHHTHPENPCSLCFEQPIANFEPFQKKLQEKCVCLENAKVDSNSNTVICSIKVQNLHPEKKVFARCTSDGWLTYADLHATYCEPGYEGSVYDNFSFAITKPLVKGSKNARVEFAICYQVHGETHWDNNDGKNYAIEWMGSK